MDYEFHTTVGKKEYKVFLQPGFWSLSNFSPLLHKHNYPEIHLFSNGEVKMSAGSKTYLLQSGDVCLVPPKTYHCFTDVTKGTIHTAFQIAVDADTVCQSNLSAQTALDFVNAIRERNYTKISAYISLMCAQFFADTTPPPTESKDYGFIISEFLSTRYRKNITLRELAEELHLSEKQTARLVRKFTGKSFTDALTEHRMKTADHLIKNTNKKPTEIASYVGYNSYSGFWKAYQKHENNKQPETE